MPSLKLPNLTPEAIVPDAAGRVKRGRVGVTSKGLCQGEGEVVVENRTGSQGVFHRITEEYEMTHRRRFIADFKARSALKSWRGTCDCPLVRA